MLFDDSQFSQNHILKHFDNKVIYEPETVDFILKNLKQKDVFIDIGTHVGFFSLLASRIVGDSGSVLSFELNPSNYSHLLAHLVINKINNVIPHNWAVTNKSEPLEFWNNMDNDGGHSLWDCGKHDFNLKSKQNPTKYAAYGIALDDYRGINNVNFIKIDTEGSEVLILKGMFNLISKFKPIIVAEVNDFALNQMGTSHDEMRCIMKDFEYDCWLLDLANPKKLKDGERHKSDNVYNLAFVHNSVDIVI